MRVVVLGAGLAGLASAYELCRHGHTVTVLEREPRVGGMAASWRVGPYQLDYGPHRFHTRSPELLAHLVDILDGEVVVRERRSRIHLRGRFFRYPLELSDVAGNLDLRLLARAGADYLAARAREWVRPSADEHFEAWVLKRFGRTLYDLFFEPYTSKAWGMPCTRISADWAGARISQADLWDALKKTLRPPGDGAARSLATRFHYPRSGGIGRIARGYARRIRALGGEILLAAPVRRLELRGRRIAAVRFEREGALERIEAEQVVNTLPLPLAMSALRPGPDAAVRAAARRLRFVSIVFVYLEVARPSVSPDHWIYLPEKHLCVHRVSEFKNFSDSAAPGESTALCCEITCRAGDATWGLTLEQAARIAERDLVATGLVERGSTRPLDVARLRHAYPIYDLDYREPLRALVAAEQAIENLTSTGRQGRFRYNNMDHSIGMGLKAARALCARAPAAARDERPAGLLARAERPA